MISPQILERLCRAGAVLIAVAALVDPVWSVSRSTAGPVVIATSSGASADDVAAVAAALDGHVPVSETESPLVAARIVVGRRVPVESPDGLTFVVTPNPTAGPAITAVDVAADIPLGTTAPVGARLAVPAAQGARTLSMTLEADGVVVDSASPEVPAGSTEAAAAFAFVPVRAGIVRLHVTAEVDGRTTSADAVTHVVERTVRVLMYEARPSWAATFVRRALETDPRFDVVVRSMTSRGVAVEAGAAPVSLERVAALDGFDVLVLGAPEALGVAEAAALERYLREREGAVVLLPSATGGPVLSRLTGVAAWSTDRRPDLEPVTWAGRAWTASEFVFPATWPAGAEPLTSCLPAAPRCAVWRVPVGGGRVVVGSAIDAWRTRAAGENGFAAFWRAIVGDEGLATPRPIAVSLETRVVEAGGVARVRVQARDAGVPPVVEWQGPDGVVSPVRMWPAGAGQFVADVRVGTVPGRARVHARPDSPGTDVNNTDASDGAVAELLIVESGSALGQWVPPVDDTDPVLSAFASSRGGAVIPMDDVASLPSRVLDALGPSPVDDLVRPMQSPWWIVPFAGLLSVDWWSRRRRGAR
jgi:hypothetical protein